MKENPARKIKKVAPEQDETQPFTREQYDALIEATRLYTDRWCPGFLSPTIPEWHHETKLHTPRRHFSIQQRAANETENGCGERALWKRRFHARIYRVTGVNTTNGWSAHY
jgi:hypothetical protein